MSTPTVTEIIRTAEPVAHDTFIDDITPRWVPTATPAADPPSRPPGYR